MVHTSNMDKIGVLQLAWTLKEGGWCSLFIMVLVAIMANYTGKALIRCLYNNSLGNRLQG